jgi:hypothetical protein
MAPTGMAGEDDLVHQPPCSQAAKAVRQLGSGVVVSELRGVELPGRPPRDLWVDDASVTVVVRSVQPVRGPFRACWNNLEPGC